MPAQSSAARKSSEYARLCIVGVRERNVLRWFGPAGMGPTGPSARTQAPYFFFFFAAFFFAIVSPPSRSARVVRC